MKKYLNRLKYFQVCISHLEVTHLLDQKLSRHVVFYKFFLDAILTGPDSIAKKFKREFIALLLIGKQIEPVTRHSMLNPLIAEFMVTTLPITAKCLAVNDLIIPQPKKVMLQQTLHL